MGTDSDGAISAPASGKLFTVGIPVFNGRSLLRNCLQSVVSSTFPRRRFEIIVADDGSSEPETLAILAEFEDSFAAEPGFFRVISLGTNSGGAARPRNRILDEATGDYVFFVDSDDTIGNLALERIAAGVATTPADWIAVNQVPVNGRGALCVVRQAHVEVPRIRALSTLTVHKCFRRAEIERQKLRFDEGLPSGQDVTFAFSFILNASRFLMLGGYDYYYLIKHTGNPNEPAHLSRRAGTAVAKIEKNERILRAMLTALRGSSLPEAEQRNVIAQVTLPRLLLRQGYLTAIVMAGPVTGPPALRRLSRLLSDSPAADLDPVELRDLTEQHLAVVAAANWLRLAQVMYPAAAKPLLRIGTRVLARGRNILDVASGRTWRRRVIKELASLRSSVEDIQNGQRRLEAIMQQEPQLRDVHGGRESSTPKNAGLPLDAG